MKRRMCVLTVLLCMVTPAWGIQAQETAEEIPAVSEAEGWEADSGSVLSGEEQQQDTEEEITETTAEAAEAEVTAEATGETTAETTAETAAEPESAESSGSKITEQGNGAQEELTAGEAGNPEETAAAGAAEEADPEQVLRKFAAAAFGSEAAVVTEQNEDGSVLICEGFGVLFAEYSENEKGIRVPVSAICWDASSDRFWTVSADGAREKLAPGLYSFYGGSVWNIGSNGSGVGGYVVDGDNWTYYLGYGDLSSGLSSRAGADGFLPDGIYHGARWTESDYLTAKGGYHSYASGKYYFRKDGTILKNGTMKVAGRYHEFGPDGREIRSYSTNYWKQERLGYYVRVDGSGNIIRSAGFYQFDGKTYYLCGNSGRRVQGWLNLKGAAYYFDEETGEQVIGYRVIDGVPYYFDPDSDQPGRKTLGSVFIDGRRYFFRYQGGSLVTGWIKGGTDGSSQYYVNSDGSLKRGWSRIASENRTYYFEPTWGYALKGFQTIDGNRYLFVPGTNAVGRGWITVDGERYYCDPSTAVLTTGFATINGRGYYFDESGRLVTDETNYRIDGKYYNFDSAGRYTEVTYTEVQILARNRLDEIGWTLRDAYDWSVMPYVHIDDTVPDGYEPADYYGLYGLRNHRGDCYVMASTFYQMAVQMGYDAHFVMGYVPLARGGMGPHGWVEIDQDGGTYVYDPDFEYDEGLNGYRIYYGKPGTWMYSSYYRTN